MATTLAKIHAFNIQRIAPLHGCVLEGNEVAEALRLYDIWSRYEVETDGVLVAYASIYGNTAAVAHCIAERLRIKGVEVNEIDLCRSDVSEAVSLAFRYGKMVLCAASYDGGVFPPMHAFLYKLGIKGYQSRRVGVVENGTWAPTAGKTICSILQQMKNVEIVSPVLTIRSAWKEDYQQDLEALLAGVIGEECM